jgi:hypothetical protein
MDGDDVKRLVDPAVFRSHALPQVPGKASSK